MKVKYKWGVCLLIIGSLIIGNSITSLATTGRKIALVSLQIDTDKKAGIKIDEDDIDIRSNSHRYSVTDYQLIHDGAEWENILPQDNKLDITLSAEDEYYFFLEKASDVKLKGNTEPSYISGKKRDSSKTLELVVKLNNISNGIGEITQANWDTDKSCIAKWASSANNSHEIAVERDGKKIGKVQIIPTAKDFIDLTDFMKWQGTYNFKVREYNVDSGKRGEWVSSSDSYQVSKEEAQENKSKAGYTSIDGYGWQQDGDKWWYKRPGNTYPQNDWLMLDNNWYYFDKQGYMVTGWQTIDGNWYFFKESGEMLANAVTPDGYTVDENGKWINQ